MSLQLILGGSGSGKTTLLYDRVIQASLAQPERQYFVIVPEQFTMQAQKDIVVRHPDHGTMNIDILSFQRLAYRIFEELAVENLQVLDDIGKSMVLRKVAASKSRQLVLFRGHLNQTGFVNQLKSMLSEFYQYGVRPEQLREMAPLAKTPLLRQKLEDFALVFEAFQEYIAGHYITTEEVLDVLCRVLPRSSLVEDSVIALDGFVGFTPVQYRLIELFLVRAKQVAVAVTAEGDGSIYRPMGIQNLFYTSRQMVVRLSQLAEKNGVAKREDIVLAGEPQRRFSDSPELGFLEKHLFRFRGASYEGEMTGSLELVQADSPSQEIAQVIHRIWQMMRQEGLRYRDAAVITGDLPGYSGEIARQFEESGIPYFMDDKKNILDNPMAELIRSALDAVRRDLDYESAFRFLRSGLVSQDPAMTDRLENYVLALGIRGGKRWRQTWERTYRGAGNLNLVRLNAYKEQVMGPLFAMQEQFRQEGITVAGMVQAVRELIAAYGAEEQLLSWQDQFLEQKEYRLAKEYGQIFGLVSQLLDRLEALLGEETVSRKEFMEILDAGFGEISVGVIPATVDRVVVGDITRTRLDHIKVLFFVGVNDGIVPAKKEGGSLLSDREREFFADHDLELAPTAREDSFQQRFYLYRMMTKPSRRLVVSFPAVGGDGKSRRPSFLIGELKKLFPKLPCRDASGGEDREIYSMEEARGQLIQGLKQFRDDTFLKEQERAAFLELFRFFAQSEDYGQEARQLAEAAFHTYEKKGIGHAVAQALYGKILSGSVTRLEQYAACAYGHFLKYGLELLERQRYQLAAADIVNLFHDSIDLCFQKVKEQGLDWRTISEEQRTGLVKQCVAQVTEEYGNTILGSSSRNAYLARRVENITQRTVWALQQQILKGDFVPAGFEVSFSAADHLDAMRISLSKEEALHLRGRIDRLDLCEDGQQVYVKIIDYKSGSTSFDLLALYYGLQLQLVVYMDAVLEMTGRQYPDKDVVPAGILYYNIADPLVQKSGQQDPEEIDGEILRKLRMNGLINSELTAIRHLDHTIEKESDIIPVVLKDGAVQEGKSSVANRERFQALRTFVHEKLKESGREILDGEIGVEPYKNGTRTACDYCPYHAVCGFDKKTSGFGFRRWRPKKSEEIWEELCRGRE